MVTHDAGLISGFFYACLEAKVVNAGCIFFFLEGG